MNKEELREKTLKLHKENKGKIATMLKVPLETKEDLSLAYTPGVAIPCLEIKENKNLAYEYTNKANLVAVVTDGSAVLGLGNIGSLAGYPVMEGKAALFKKFSNIDAIPVCLDTQDTEEIIRTVKNIAPTFGGINLEDISAPRCFEIEQRLKKELDIPVFHDDQHGTAIVVLAGLINALKLVEKKIEDIKIVLSGAGAAGYAIFSLLMQRGAKNIVVVDSKGIIYKGRTENMNFFKEKIAEKTATTEKGDIHTAIKNADVFIGVSTKDLLNESDIRSMQENAVVFAMANPDPEIMPDKAKEYGAKIAASGRSDFPNQINNVLVFPGLFRGALDARSKITDEMKIAAAEAIADLVSDDELNPDYIIPSALDKRVAEAVAEAVKAAAKNNKT